MNEELLVLLNAYLDGALNAGQRQKLEERLAVDTQARQLLGELRQVSATVARLPRVNAPAELAQRVYAEMEREALLGKEEPVAENLGQRHLQLRRFLAAAAMLALAGAIVVIAVSTFSGQGKQAPPPRDLAAAPRLDPLSNLAHLIKTPEQPAPADAALARSAPVINAVPPEPAPYTSLSLAFNVKNPASAIGHLLNLLVDHSLDVKHAQPQPGHHLYTFICSVEEFRALLPGLNQIDGGLNLVASSFGPALAPVRITPDQALTLASSRTLADFLRQEQVEQVPPADLAFSPLLDPQGPFAILEAAPEFGREFSVHLLGPEPSPAAAPVTHAHVVAAPEAASAPAAPDQVSVTLLLIPEPAPQPDPQSSIRPAPSSDDISAVSLTSDPNQPQTDISPDP